MFNDQLVSIWKACREHVQHIAIIHMHVFIAEYNCIGGVAYILEVAIY